MPGRNNTGPLGQGPMTGRGLGLCHHHPNKVTTMTNTTYGQGRISRRGFRCYGGLRGFGYRNVPSLQEERELLRNRLTEVDALLASKQG